MIFHHSLLESLVVRLHARANLSRLLACVLDLLFGSRFLLLKHAHPILQLQHILLKLQPNRPSLCIGQILGLEVNDHVLLLLAALVSFPL